ncbi:MAG: hypothetical protein NTZ34_02180 [Chloroflexi bacterium]|nr:hypothetical protein [Chloroflexota bacterium]
MSLKDWLNDGWVKPHRSSAQEINNLLGIADRDIIQSKLPGLDNDTRLTIAYNAALQCCAAALAAEGYRISREAHHFRLIQSLRFTLNLDSTVIELLDSFRKKRNISDYERAGTVSEQEAAEMLELAKKLRNEVAEWLRNKHAGLIA